ncbi:MAG: D-Ala-D-Ala carboxypeptidase family metallohydrolase [Myxococcota bacterium]
MRPVMSPVATLFLGAALVAAAAGCSVEGAIGAGIGQDDGFGDAAGSGGRGEGGGVPGTDGAGGGIDTPGAGATGGGASSTGAGGDPDGGEGGAGGAPPPPPPPTSPNTVCFPGADMSYTTCFPTVGKDANFPSGYSYPSNASPNYQPPTRFIDLTAHSSSIKLAPNFTLGELMQEWKGDYAIYEPHVVAKLQALRDQSGGTLSVNSGFRSPGYNTGVGGATYSRHMYGDAADMASSVVSLNTMKNLCEGLQADFINLYTSHIHCDWRNEAKDPAFFDAPSAPAQFTSPGSGAGAPAYEASLHVAPDGRWHAEITDFDEGEPYREWAAFDREGDLVEVVADRDYAPPAAAAHVEVMVGGQRTVVVPDVSAPHRWHVVDAVDIRLETVPDDPGFDAGHHRHE